MKKLLIVLFLSMVGVGYYSTADAASSSAPEMTLNTQDYCPAGYICEATNVQAWRKTDGYGAYPKIDVEYIFRNGQDVIAHVKGQGNLRCTKRIEPVVNGKECWSFQANGFVWYIPRSAYDGGL